MKQKSKPLSKNSRKPKLPKQPPSKEKRRDSKRKRDWPSLLNNKESKKSKKDRESLRRRQPRRLSRLSWRLSQPRQRLIKLSKRKQLSKEG